MAKRRVVLRELVIDDLPPDATGADMARAMSASFERTIASVPEEHHGMLREKFATVLRQCEALSPEQVRAATLADALDARAEGIGDFCDMVAALGARCSRPSVQLGPNTVAPHQFFMLGQAQADASTALLCMRTAADNLRKALKVPELCPADDAEPEPPPSGVN